MTVDFIYLFRQIEFAHQRGRASRTAFARVSSWRGLLAGANKLGSPRPGPQFFRVRRWSPEAISWL